jgi:hypothetical protein
MEFIGANVKKIGSNKWSSFMKFKIISDTKIPIAKGDIRSLGILSEEQPLFNVRVEEVNKDYVLVSPVYGGRNSVAEKEYQEYCERDYPKESKLWLSAYPKNTEVEKKNKMVYHGEIKQIHGFEEKTYVKCVFDVDTPISYTTKVMHKTGEGIVDSFYSYADYLNVKVIFPNNCCIANGDAIQVECEDVEELSTQEKETVLANVSTVIPCGHNEVGLNFDIIEHDCGEYTYLGGVIKSGDNINGATSVAINITPLDMYDEWNALEKLEEFGEEIIAAAREAQEKMSKQ